jgi:hypothetical protein
LVNADDLSWGFKKADRVALFQISTADMRTVELSSIPIENVLSLPAETLRRELQGRVAVIGNAISTPALQSTGGSSVHAEVVTALVLDSLFAALERNGGIAGFSRIGALLLAAALGALAGLAFENDWVRRWMALTAGVIVGLLVSFALAWWLRLIWVPIAAIASLILAAELLVRLRRFGVPAWERT